MTTVYYLQWDSPNEDVREQAADLFHEFHHDPPETLTEADFDELYEEIAEVATNDLEQLYAEWNHGSGHESDQFQDLRYCERCQTYIEGSDDAVTHAAQNHGHDTIYEFNEPEYIHGTRSLSVGDIAAQNGEYYGCAPIGWQDLQLVEE